MLEVKPIVQDILLNLKKGGRMTRDAIAKRSNHDKSQIKYYLDLLARDSVVLKTRGFNTRGNSSYFYEINPKRIKLKNGGIVVHFKKAVLVVFNKPTEMKRFLGEDFHPKDFIPASTSTCLVFLNMSGGETNGKRL